MRLAEDLAKMMHVSEQGAAEKCSPAAAKDFADACLSVEGRNFR